MLQKNALDKALSAARQPVLLKTEAQLKSAAEQWNDSPSLGIDTEFVRERTYRAHLGLIQISDGHTAWLADPLALQSMNTVTELMSRPETVKILHSCSEDLEVLYNVLGVLPEPMVDTQIACAMLGQPLQLGYHSAVKWIFDIDIDKDQTRSNWLYRPLNTHQLRYAAMDVVLLPKMYQELHQRLEEAGRWSWLIEDVNRMKRNTLNPQEPEDAYLRFHGIGRMDQATLKTLQALAAWREVTAKTRDLARGFVISDAGIMRLANRKPTSRAEIQDIEDIHPGALRRYQRTLLELIARAPENSIEVVRIEEFSNVQKKQLKSMQQLVKARSEEMSIDPALLASRRELEKLIRAISSDQAPPERFMGWRKPVITDDLLQIC